MQNETPDKKMPFLPEETLRIQRVGVYLNDLKDRLRDLRHQHDEVILHSVEIIREINEVSSTLCIADPLTPENRESLTRIKRLIREFENLHPSRTNTVVPVPVESGRVEIKKILENFEKLNESHVLRESLLYFKRAKESFEKIDDYLDKLNAGCGGGGGGGVGNSSSVASNSNTLVATQPEKTPPNSHTIREKINMFNMAVEGIGNHFSSCCSSATSLDAYQSAEEIQINPDSANTAYQSGYEGDVDSEMEVTTFGTSESFSGLSD